MKWFSVRCVFRDDTTYEERITLWEADDFDDAIARAEADASDYAENVGVEYLGLAQAYCLPDEPTDGAEVFSLMRDSDLPSSEYLNAFFDSGSESQRRS